MGNVDCDLKVKAELKFLQVTLQRNKGHKNDGK